MPKIVIKETAKVTAARGEYENFTVVVLGPINEASKIEKFDNSGVCEFTDQTIFKDTVGLIAATTISSTAKAPEEITGEGIVTYTLTDNANDKLAFNNLASLNGVYYLKEPKTAADTDYGYLKSTTHKYTKITNDSEFTAGTYVMLKSEGSDVVSYSQYGNQIAYELLGLGYTVLYRAFYPSDYSESDTSDLVKALVGKNIVSMSNLGNYEKCWSLLEDKAEYDFRYALSGIIEGDVLIGEKTVSQCISALCDKRGDCTALIDIDASKYNGTNQVTAVNNIKESLSGVTASEYTALFAPYVVYDMKVPSEYNSNTTFPASFHYLACAAKAFENYREWYAVAGYTRGISKYKIVNVGCVFGENAINTLEPRNSDNGVDKAVNLIVKIKNNFYLWGNRTAYELVNSSSENGDLNAKHFLNIRQLCTTIKKQVYVACRRFTFDPNSDVLWLNFCNAIKPTLEKMRADQGIEDYKLIKVKNVKKATLQARIRIVPIEAVEDFEIELFLENSINGTVVEEKE